MRKYKGKYFKYSWRVCGNLFYYSHSFFVILKIFLINLKIHMYVSSDSTLLQLPWSKPTSPFTWITKLFLMDSHTLTFAPLNSLFLAQRPSDRLYHSSAHFTYILRRIYEILCLLSPHPYNLVCFLLDPSIALSRICLDSRGTITFNAFFGWAFPLARTSLL